MNKNSIFLAFPGVIRWQSRLWEIITNFNKIRQDNSIAPIGPNTQAEFDKYDMELFNARNHSTAYVTYNIENHILNSAFKGPQSLTKTLGVSNKLCKLKALSKLRNMF